MNIKCNDGFVRSFIPAQQATVQKVNSIFRTLAYCEHCRYKFSNEESIKQKEVWRNHSCNTDNLKKWKI